MKPFDRVRDGLPAERHARVRSNAGAILLTGQPAQVTVRIGTASEFVKARPAEGAMGSVPPYEVRNRGGGGQDKAHRNQQKEQSPTHGKAKYNTPSLESRRKVKRADAFSPRRRPARPGLDRCRIRGTLDAPAVGCDTAGT